MSSTQDLGLVTAYGYAVSGGYEGTEQEFMALLGSQQTYHDEAVQAAEDAEAYAAQAMSGTPAGYADVVSTVNSLNSALANVCVTDFGIISSGNSKTFTVPNNYRGFIYIASSSSEAGGFIIITANSSGGVSTTLLQGTRNSISTTSATNSLQISVNFGSYVFAIDIVGTHLSVAS